MTKPWVRNARPITDAERPYLKRLGDGLRAVRAESGLTVFEFCRAALLSCKQFEAIRAGAGRTRRSTLGRMVDVAVEANPDLGPADVLLERLVELAGPALAPESEYPDRVERKLLRRVRHRDLGTWIP